MRGASCEAQSSDWIKLIILERYNSLSLKKVAGCSLARAFDLDAIYSEILALCRSIRIEF